MSKSDRQLPEPASASLSKNIPKKGPVTGTPPKRVRVPLLSGEAQPLPLCASRKMGGGLLGEPVGTQRVMVVGASS